MEERKMEDVLKENEELKKKCEELEKENEELKRKLKELEDYARRLKAKFENYRKEVAKEKQEIIKNANEYLVNKLVQILEDFERAIENAEPSESFVEGVKKIHSKLLRILESEGLSVIEPEGKFDPFEHEAFEKIETDEHEEYSIIDVVEKGYKFQGKVLKPAKVKVAVKPREKGGDES